MSLDVNNLCVGCMTEKTDPRGRCPTCGFEEGEYLPAPHHLPVRTILNGKYMLGRVLGEGGFGLTYLGWDLNLDLKLAIKEYYPTGFVTRDCANTRAVTAYTGDSAEFYKNGREKFINEAKTLAKFYALPGIVSVKDFFLENGTAYIVMEFIDGQTLKEYLRQMGGKLPAAQVFDMMKPLMRSLAEVHKAEMIHRDISPDNIMITKEGNVKLLDFGAARDFSDGNKSLSVLLKPGYAPEEQYRTHGKQGPWTDIYALCATMYRAITAETPEESLERLQWDTLKTPSALGVRIDRRQEFALMKGLAVSQKNRWQSIKELMGAFEGYCGGESVPALEPVPTPPPAPPAAKAAESHAASLGSWRMAPLPDEPPAAKAAESRAASLGSWRMAPLPDEPPAAKATESRAASLGSWRMAPLPDEPPPPQPVRPVGNRRPAVILASVCVIVFVFFLGRALFKNDSAVIAPSPPKSSSSSRKESLSSDTSSTAGSVKSADTSPDGQYSIKVLCPAYLREYLEKKAQELPAVKIEAEYMSFVERTDKMESLMASGWSGGYDFVMDGNFPDWYLPMFDAYGTEAYAEIVSIDPNGGVVTLFSPDENAFTAKAENPGTYLFFRYLEEHQSDDIAQLTGSLNFLVIDTQSEKVQHTLEQFLEMFPTIDVKITGMVDSDFLEEMQTNLKFESGYICLTETATYYLSDYFPDSEYWVEPAFTLPDGTEFNMVSAHSCWSPQISAFWTWCNIQKQQ